MKTPNLTSFGIMLLGTAALALCGCTQVGTRSNSADSGVSDSTTASTATMGTMTTVTSGPSATVPPVQPEINHGPAPTGR